MVSSINCVPNQLRELNKSYLCNFYMTFFPFIQATFYLYLIYIISPSRKQLNFTRTQIRLNFFSDMDLELHRSLLDPYGGRSRSALQPIRIHITGCLSRRTVQLFPSKGLTALVYQFFTRDQKRRFIRIRIHTCKYRLKSGFRSRSRMEPGYLAGAGASL